jgi:DNA-binding transcriptional MocR family regulator
VTATVPSVVQFRPPPGVCDLGPGQLDPALLPVRMLAECAAEAAAGYGADALAYGAQAGPGPLRTALAALASARDGPPYAAEHVLVTAGTSAALDGLAAELAAAGRVLLVEALSYDLAMAIFAHRGVRTARVPLDLDPDALDRAFTLARRRTGRPAALYLVPTFHNPTGRVLPVARRHEVVAVARAHGALVVSDDAYADLGYDGAPPPPLAALAGHDGTVLELGTFAKCLASGLRVGWLAGSAGTVAARAAAPVLRSGGGFNHHTAVTLAVALDSGRFAAHLARLRTELRARRDALVGALRAGLPAGCAVREPAGGFFAWVDLPPGADEAAACAAAADRGVWCAPGSRFGAPPAPGLRLSFTYYPPDALATAGAAVADAVRAVPR